MNKAEQELLNYLKAWYNPIPGGEERMKQFIHAVWQSGMEDAAGIADRLCVQTSKHVANSHIYSSNVQQAILTAVSKP